MKAFPFPGHNRTLVAPDCHDLPVYTDGQRVTSCWQLSAEDLELLRHTGYLWITLLTGSSQPPIMVQFDVPEHLVGAKTETEVPVAGLGPRGSCATCSCWLEQDQARDMGSCANSVSPRHQEQVGDEETCDFYLSRVASRRRLPGPPQGNGHRDG